ncbi:MAG: L-seryl-tRNA(Sec) selenium transferase [Thermomicrobiales bacterium]
MSADDPRRSLPAVHRLLDVYRSHGGTAADEYATPIIRALLDRLRASSDPLPATQDIEAMVQAELSGVTSPRLRKVLNGTGAILHTNLGRAPVSAKTSAAMAEVASGYIPLEIELETGRRGGRMSEIDRLMQVLTGAEAALIVNNNAAAVLLALSALAFDREVIVSRGEAIEIGGGVRIPDVLAQSGARMVEVGTTNRTYARDYAAAIGPKTAAMLKVHPSNFHISGFVHKPQTEELAAVAKAHGVVLIEDQGSGVLLDPARFGLSGEVPVSASIAAGVDIVTMSGDKLIGGPQAGIIAGKRELVDRCLKHPLARAVRADKATLAGMAETLRHYIRGEAETEIPIWRMISVSLQSLFDRGTAIRTKLAESGVALQLKTTSATIGGGSLPGETLPSLAVALSGGNLDARIRQLRMGETPIFARVEDDHIQIDLRTILPEDDELLGTALTIVG